MPHYSERLLTDVKAAEQATQGAKARTLRSLGATVAQQNALTVLDDRDGLTAAELARRCGVTPQTMSGTISRLESQGLVTRSPHPLHRTLVELHLTDAGREVFRRADASLTTLDTQLTAELTAHQVATLKTLLRRVTEAARRAGEAGGRPDERAG